MDSGKTDNERELTSTMGNVLSVSIKDEKNDTSGSDATPTSSTDANTTTTSSRIVSDDPISSTSSDVVELNRSKNLEASSQSSVEISETTMDEPDKSSAVDPETDLLEMSISSVSREKITEDVEDLVHDLESLLGESTDSFNIPIKRREDQKSPTAKEIAKPLQTPSESGDTSSPEDPASDKNVEITLDYDNKEDEIIETSNSSMQEETATEKTVVSNINESEENEQVNEAVSSDTDKESPIHTPVEPETTVVSENIVEVPSDEKVNESKPTCETENAEGSEAIGEVECVTVSKEEDLVEEESHTKEENVEKDTNTNEGQSETEKVGEQPADEQTSEKTDAEDNTSECKPSDQVQNEEESEDQTVEKEIEQSEVILIASSSDQDIQDDEPEKTVEAVICPEESISRDVKTDTVAPIDNEHEESQSSTNKELETCLVEVSADDPCVEIDMQNDDNKDDDVEESHGESPQEIAETEEVVSEALSETDIQVESKLDETAAVEAVSESSDQDQVEETPTVSSQDVEEVQPSVSEQEDQSSLVEVAQDSEQQQDIPEEVGEDFELILTEETDNLPTEAPEEVEEVSEVVVEEVTEDQRGDLPDKEESSDPAPTPEVESHQVDISEEEEHNTEDSGPVDAAKDAAEADTDIESSVGILKDESSEVQEESQANIPKILSTESDTENSSAAMVEDTEDNPIMDTKESAQSIDDAKTGPPVELEAKSPVVEDTLVNDATEGISEFVAEEMTTETNEDEDKTGVVITEVLSGDENYEIENASVRMIITEITDEVVTTDNSAVEITEIIEMSEAYTHHESLPEEITDDVPQSEEVDTATNIEGIETEITEKLEEQVPEVSEDVETDTGKLEDQVPEVTEDIETEIAGKLEDQVPEVSEDVETEIAEKLEDQVPEVSQDVETEIVEKLEDQVPEVSEDVETEIAEKLEEQVPEVGEDVEDEVQVAEELTISDEVSSPQQKIEEKEDEDIVPVNSEETCEKNENSDELNLVAEESVEKDIPGETESMEDLSNQMDETPKFSIVTSAYSEITNEIDESGDASPVEAVNDSQIEPDATELLEEVSEDNKQEHVLQWVEDSVPMENEDACSTSEVIEDDAVETISDNNIIEILDEDSKTMEPETETVSFFTPGGDSDSEDTVPTLVLEPDEVLPSPEPAGSEKDLNQVEITSVAVISADDTDIPPEIEEILNDQGNVDDVVENIDMQENLETILAVASLQATETVDTEEVVAVEPQMSDRERREMEALRKAVESITESAETAEYDDVDQISELVETVEQFPSGTEAVDNLVEESQSTSKVCPGDQSEASIAAEDEVDLEEKHVQSSVELNEVECVTIKEVITEENHMKGYEPDTSEDKISPSGIVQEVVDDLPDSSQGILICEEVKTTESSKEKEGRAKVNERSKRHKKCIADSKLEELSINVDVPDREKPYSPKVTIKPIKVPDEEVSTTSNSDSEVGKGSLKMTITKQFDKMHSVLKICESDNSEPIQEQDEPIPKLIIKPKMQQVEQQHSPKMSTRSSKQMYSPTSSSQRSGSPRITIKPVVKPDKAESVSPLKIKIKPEEVSKRHSPKLNIKPVAKPEEEGRENIQSPRKVTIKPVKTPEELEQIQSPRITIKPIPKPELEKEAVSVTPRLSIKPIKRDEEEVDVERERSSPKITIKPVKPPEPDTQATEPDDAVKERIVLKINKGNLPTPTKESKKREHPPDDEKSEKLAKITVKFSKGGGHPHIVQQTEETNKRTHDEHSPERAKKLKTDNEPLLLTRSKHKDESFLSDTSKMKQKETEIHPVESRSTPIEAKRVKLKDTPESSKQRDSNNEAQRSRTNNEYSDDVRIIETKLDSPIVISEDSRSQDSGSCIIIEDRKDSAPTTPIYDTSMKVATPETPQTVPMKQDSASSTPTAPVTPTPRKRGRPRKVPIVVREEFKEQEEPKKEEPPQLLHESGRPKRSCRGQSVRATLGIKPRKPRGPGRGRGSKRGMGTRVVPMKPEGEPKLSKAKLKLIQESLKVELPRTDDFIEKDKRTPELSQEDIKPPAPILTQTIEVPCSPSTLQPEPSPQGLLESPASLPGASPKPTTSILVVEITDSLAVPTATPSTSRAESVEIVMVDEETRMSADTNSRAHTPAKQVAPADVVIEESQSSVQSTGTTESGKATSSRPNKAPRLEVQEPEGAVISADQLTEYYWNGNGPFMLQEQVAQFLGIKSFKRKYPGIMRRMLEIQERDFIRESGLASEHMCDLGLTAVNSADILDIMYSDFQEKYEEYCKHQRDRQAKELINKQKALTLAASQDKNKADITEQAVQSAAQWNASFNKARKEHRKACMDLQTLTVHYPKGKMKQINKPKVGNYPVALVPGQFTDYYKEFTPTEINNLPLSTMLYNEINIVPPEESEESGTEGSESDSDSSSSSSGSCSSSSGVEDCKLCKHTPKKGSSK